MRITSMRGDPSGPGIRATHVAARCRGLQHGRALLKAAAQLLANLANGAGTQALAFRACWPDALLKIALANAPQAHEAACQAVYNFCRADKQAAEQVCAFPSLCGTCSLVT
jgi:hypothetical protein